MAKNKLVLNSDKTHLLVMASQAKHRLHQDYGIVLDTGSEIIKPQKHEILLGGIISNDLKWSEFLRDHEKSLFKCLNTRLNALAKISCIASFKTRKKIANGIFLSKLIYLIQAWGGCSEFLLSFLQILQNRGARYVTKLGWFTPVSTLLNQCGWLSVRQLVAYHSIVLLFKTKRDRKPTYFYEKVGKEYTYKTRLASENGIVKMENRVTKDLSHQNFSHKSTQMWNELPSDIRQAPSLPVFKTMVKAWIKTNIEIK